MRPRETISIRAKRSRDASRRAYQTEETGLRAARVEGELESLRESNAQLLAHVGASAAKSPAKGRSKPNKPEGQ